MTKIMSDYTIVRANSIGLESEGIKEIAKVARVEDRNHFEALRLEPTVRGPIDWNVDQFGYEGLLDRVSLFPESPIHGRGGVDMSDPGHS